MQIRHFSNGLKNLVKKILGSFFFGNFFLLEFETFDLALQRPEIPDDEFSIAGRRWDLVRPILISRLNSDTGNLEAKKTTKRNLEKSFIFNNTTPHEILNSLDGFCSKNQLISKLKRQFFRFFNQSKERRKWLNGRTICKHARRKKWH